MRYASKVLVTYKKHTNQLSALKHTLSKQKFSHSFILSKLLRTVLNQDYQVIPVI